MNLKRIYLVHDAQENPLERKSFLEASGFSVTLCRSGACCQQLLDEQMPFAIVMDILLEGENGFEVCRRLRQKHSPERLPIVLCTEIYRAQIYRDLAVEVGAQAYMLRPIVLEDLVRTIGAAAAKPQVQRT
jgi:CheY-like chemotaxis protein